MKLETMREAIHAIGDAVDLNDFQLDGDGSGTLGLNERVLIHLQEVNEFELEISVPIFWISDELNSTMLDALLALNAQIKSGRFSIKPGSKDVFFGRRIFIREHTKATLLSVIDGIAMAASKWNVAPDGDLIKESSIHDLTKILFDIPVSK